MTTMKDFLAKRRFQDDLEDEITRVVADMKLLWSTISKDCRIYHILDGGVFRFHLFKNCKFYYRNLESYYSDNNHIYAEWDLQVSRKLEFFDEKSTKYELRLFKEYRHHEIVISNCYPSGSVKRQLIDLTNYAPTTGQPGN